jgi:hypothetical protein
MWSQSRLVGCALAAALLAGCAAPQAAPPTTAPPTAASTGATSAPVSVASPVAPSPITSASSRASPAASPVSVAGSPSPSAAASPARSPVAAAGPGGSPVAGAAAGDTTARIVAAANALLTTFNDAQRSQAVFPFTDEAGKAGWSNLPRGLFKWVGVPMGDLSAAQQQAVHDLLRATLSPTGYERVMASVNADEYLKSQSGSNPLQFGADNYFVAVFGTPSTTAPWMFRFGGHHMTVNATVVGSNIALTPSFPGCQPCEYTANGQSLRPDGVVVDKAFALVNALDAGQQQQAVLGSQSIDLVLGPNQPMRNVPPEGLKVSAMSAPQRAMLLDLVSQYVGMLNDQSAEQKMVEVQGNLDSTYFAWYGPTAPGSVAYFRIQGPTLWIEHAPQGGGGPGGDGSPSGPSAGGTPGAQPNGSPPAGGPPGGGPPGGGPPGGGTPGAKPSGGPPNSGAPSDQGQGLGLGGAPTANHVHSIFRDPTNEYGVKWAGQ